MLSVTVLTCLHTPAYISMSWFTVCKRFGHVGTLQDNSEIWLAFHWIIHCPVVATCRWLKSIDNRRLLKCGTNNVLVSKSTPHMHAVCMLHIQYVDSMDMSYHYHCLARSLEQTPSLWAYHSGTITSISIHHYRYSVGNDDGCPWTECQRDQGSRLMTIQTTSYEYIYIYIQHQRSSSMTYRIIYRTVISRTHVCQMIMITTT